MSALFIGWTCLCRHMLWIFVTDKPSYLFNSKSKAYTFPYSDPAPGPGSEVSHTSVEGIVSLFELILPKGTDIIVIYD